MLAHGERSCILIGATDCLAQHGTGVATGKAHADRGGDEIMGVGQHGARARRICMVLVRRREARATIRETNLNLSSRVSPWATTSREGVRSEKGRWRRREEKGWRSAAIPTPPSHFFPAGVEIYCTEGRHDVVGGNTQALQGRQWERQRQGRGGERGARQNHHHHHHHRLPHRRHVQRPLTPSHPPAS